MMRVHIEHPHYYLLLIGRLYFRIGTFSTEIEDPALLSLRNNLFEHNTGESAQQNGAGTNQGKRGGTNERGEILKGNVNLSEDQSSYLLTYARVESVSGNYAVSENIIISWEAKQNQCHSALLKCNNRD